MPRGTVTNGLLQSAAMNAAPWSASNIPTRTIGQADPWGGTTATLLVESTDGGATSHEVEQTPAASFNQRWCIASCYVKAGTRGYFALAPNAGANVAIFDLTNLAVAGGNGTLAAQGITAGIEIAREDAAWRRLWVAYLQSTNSALRHYICNSASAPITYTGTGGNAMTIAGCMLEVAAPGQETPSPFVASGASAGVGPRDYRENLALQSEDISIVGGAPWVQSAVGNAAYAGALPTGVSKMVTLTGTSAVSAHATYQNASSGYTGSETRTFACYAAKVSGSGFIVLAGRSGNAYAYFDLNGGVATVGALCTAVMVPTNVAGIYRCAITYTHDGAAETCRLYLSSGVGTISYNAAADGVAVGGIQVARTNRMPDYVKTTSGLYIPNGAPRRLAA